MTGKAQLAGQRNLLELNELQLRALRGREVAMIFQEPMTSLNPVMRVGAQVEEAIRAHYPKMPAEQVQKWTLEALRVAAVPVTRGRERGGVGSLRPVAGDPRPAKTQRRQSASLLGVPFAEEK